MIAILSVFFIIGYLFIVAEEYIKVNKAATALLTGVICWSIMFLMNGPDNYHSPFESIIFETSSILFFLIGAMTIVELMDAHDAFSIITSKINATKGSSLLVIIAIITFFMSAVLDNLTTSIVMISIIRKIIPEKTARSIFAGMIIIAANAGGAWSPIGDVTTTMLWIKNLVSTDKVILNVFLASVVSAIIPLFILMRKVKSTEIVHSKLLSSVSSFHRKIMFFTGLGGLIFVPVFKTYTHLPPFMGIMFSLGVIWIIGEILNYKRSKEDKEKFAVTSIIRKIDMPGIIFFLGILMAVGSLQVSGILTSVASSLDSAIGNLNVISVLIGLASAVVDNVPIVAATIGMYDLPLDHSFWHFIAYTAGTGGSCLIIGSAAGVAVMGIEHISFIWYFKNISLPALIGYLFGAGVYLLQLYIF